DIIKGNASEVARIAGENVQTKGVDSSEVKKDLIELAKYLAVKRKATVVITGKEDIAANKDKHFIIKNGCDMMAHVVGTGCMAASVIGAFSAVEKDLAKASAAGLTCYEIAAELACKESSGPGTFKERLFDNIYNLDKEKIEKLKRIE
ncbi:hydroxyethylthiazole kinase, partial [Candidatus Omnitrophota bacterium]